MITGDLNFHFNKSDRSITEFKKILLTKNLIQHIQTHTHVLENILDLVITSRFFKYNINKLPITNLLSDHYAVPILIDVYMPPLLKYIILSIEIFLRLMYLISVVISDHQFTLIMYA